MLHIYRRVVRLAVVAGCAPLLLGACSSDSATSTEAVAETTTAPVVETTAEVVETTTGVEETTAAAEETSPETTAGGSFDLTGAELTIKNTIQIAAPPTAGGTGGVETPIEVLLSAPEGAMTATATVGAAVEFPGFITLWDVDVKSNEIRFTNVVKAEPRPGFFRVIEKDTFDRYYVTSPTGFIGRTVQTDNPAVAAEIRDSGELVITVGEGYDNRGTGFTVQVS